MLRSTFSPSATVPRRPSAAGLTLIELLTVIAIIGVLASLVFAGIGAWRGATHRAQCISNFRQLGVAILNYTNDNKGWYPGPLGVEQSGASYSRKTFVNPQARTLHFYLQPYVDTKIPPNSTDTFVMPIMLCPAWNTAADYYIGDDYEKNPDTPYAPEHWRANPSPFGRYDKVFRRRKVNDPAINPTKIWAARELYDAADNKTPKPWHGTKYNQVYLDGHVETRKVPAEYLD